MNDGEWVEHQLEAENLVKNGLVRYLEDSILGSAPDSYNGTFTTGDVKKYYETQIQYFKNNVGNCCTFVINFEHLESFVGSDETPPSVISQEVRKDYLRLYETLRHSVFEFLTPKINDEDLVYEKVFVGFTDFKYQKSLRETECKNVGELCAITGTVTRTGEVRPELFKGKFVCADCGTKSELIQQRFVFTKPIQCENPQCEKSSSFQLVVDESELVNFQKVRIQENTDDIPSGTIPRSMDIICRNDMVEVAKPGDKMLFFGTFVVVPEAGKMVTSKLSKEEKNDARKQGTNKGRGQNEGGIGEGVTGLHVLGVRDMTYKLCFLCHYCASNVGGKVDRLTNNFLELNVNLEMNFVDTLTPPELEVITRMKNDTQIFQNLVKSIAPMIYGYDDIKKGILLQMIGGVHKVTAEEGINLRGDVNICIVGDPGTAKSQFLKYVSHVLPRAIYTSGKASSSAGLTASVVKNNDTGDFAIEAGALMLADNGICCIDEFDKMNVYDQVAIHEAMEQQTISIAKAGIRATLHARTAILAAANPVGGKYDNSKTLRANIGYTLSPAIISRFDLFFIVCDKYDPDVDTRISNHILSVHVGEASPPPYSPAEVRLYIRYIESEYNPSMTKEALQLLSKTYTSLRRRDKVQSHSYRITVRQLESLVRLSEAIARVYCDEKVRKRHAQEALLLLQNTQTKLDLPEISIEQGDYNDYIKEIKKANKRREKDLFSRKRRNVREILERLSSMKDKLKLKEQELEELKSKLNSERQKKREVMVGNVSGDIEDCEQKIKRKENQIRIAEKEIQRFQEKIAHTDQKYQDEKRKEDLHFETLDDELKEEIRQDDIQEEAKTPRKKRKTGKPKRTVNLSHESYKTVCSFLTSYILEKEKEDKSIKITTLMLIEAAIEKNLDDEIQYTEDVDSFKKLMMNIISRLIRIDNILMDIEVGSEEEFENHKIIVNPNFVP